MDKVKEAAKELLGLSGGASKGFGSPTKKTPASLNGTKASVDENGEVGWFPENVWKDYFHILKLLYLDASI